MGDDIALAVDTQGNYHRDLWNLFVNLMRSKFPEKVLDGEGNEVDKPDDAGYFKVNKVPTAKRDDAGATSHLVVEGWSESLEVYGEDGERDKTLELLKRIFTSFRESGRLMIAKAIK